MTKKKIIFHYPGTLCKVLNTGEAKRPVRMLNAFESLGYEVTCITGTRSERKGLFNKIKPHLKEFDFIYSENSNIPLELCSSSRRPCLFNPDVALFKKANQMKIPTGVFYRDVFWKYPPFKKQLGAPKFYFGLPFYKREINLYQKYASRIFLPSNRVKAWLPQRNKEKLSILPPGEPVHHITKTKQVNNILNLLYVGSIRPPKYDLSLLLKELSSINSDLYSLIINTREDDWKTFSDYYNLPNSTKLEFKTGEDLSPLYCQADIALCYIVPDEYWKIALPLKLFEAIGYGLPVLSYGDSAVSDFVRENDIGWVVHEDDKNIFEYLINNRDEIEKKRENVIAIRPEHTWKKRAEQAIEALKRKRF